MVYCMANDNLQNEDELHHRDTALKAGGVDLPLPVRIAMTGISKLMTKTSYYI